MQNATKLIEPRVRRPNADGSLPDFYAPLPSPIWLDVSMASHMRADDPVIGLTFDGSAWALPWWMMKNHHVANLDLNGRAVVVTLCEMCSSSAAHDAVIDGRRYHFRLAGHYNGTIMPMDDETGSYWTGFTGECVAGKLEGTKIQRLPSWLCTWQEWIDLFPATKVPLGEHESRFGHGARQTPGSPWVGTMGDMIRDTDDRIPHYSLVLEAKVEGSSRSYPLEAIGRRGPVLNDVLNGEEIVIFSRPGTWLACVYSRNLNGRLLDFQTEGDSIVDLQTRSLWGIFGVAQSGPMMGRQLGFINSGIKEFYVWAAFNPGMEVFGAHDWQPGRAHAQWGMTDLSQLVGRMFKNDWWTNGMRVLVIGSEDGLLPAWLAECGMEVLSIHTDPALVVNARARFRGVEGLAFDARQQIGPHDDGGQFDAIVGMGEFTRVAPTDCARHAADLAAVLCRGGSYLILSPLPPGRLEQRQQNISRLYAECFDTTGAFAMQLPDLVSGTMIDGCALLLTKR